MASINSVVLIGRLTRDVDLRVTPNGVSVAKITLAVDRVPGRDGSKETDFIDCVLFGKTAEVTSDYCGKGKLVGIQGRIQVRNWEANVEGTERDECAGWRPDPGQVTVDTPM